MTEDHDHNTSEDGLSGPKDLAREFTAMLRGQAWVLALILVGVVALEVGLRVVRPDMAGLTYGPAQTGGHPIVLSGKSFRVGQITDAPMNPVIIALGDSTTFGTGVGALETWPLQLAGQPSITVPVANAGFPGGDPAILTAGLRDVWSSPVPPKVVLLMVTSNMISFTQFRQSAGERDPLQRVRALRRVEGQSAGLKRQVVELVQSSTVWKALSLNVEIFKYGIGLLGHRTGTNAPLSPLLAYGWQQPDLPSDQFTDMWALFTDELAVLRQETENLGACLVIGYLPPRFMLSDRISDNLKFVPKDRLTFDAATQVGDIARDLGAQFINLTEPLASASGASGPLFIPGDYTHLSAQGHAIVASVFAQSLQTNAACDVSEF